MNQRRKCMHIIYGKESSSFFRLYRIESRRFKMRKQKRKINCGECFCCQCFACLFLSCDDEIEFWIPFSFCWSFFRGYSYFFHQNNLSDWIAYAEKVFELFSLLFIFNDLMSIDHFEKIAKNRQKFDFRFFIDFKWWRNCFIVSLVVKSKLN